MNSFEDLGICDIRGLIVKLVLMYVKVVEYDSFLGFEAANGLSEAQKLEALARMTSLQGFHSPTLRSLNFLHRRYSVPSTIPTATTP
jgi:hypothetical protein